MRRTLDRRSLVLACSLAVASAATPKVHGGEPGSRPAASRPATKPTGHHHHEASDGATVHHRFDDVAKWQARFDDPARDAWQKPAELVAALALKAGDVVADLGAGTGYLVHHLAKAVGPEGVVYAVEVEPNLVAHLRDRAETDGTQNVIPVLASLANPRLPRGVVDLVIVLDTYHHIDQRRQYFADLRSRLAPGGRLVVVDFKKGDLPVGPQDDAHKLAPEQVVRELTEAGYVTVASPDLLPHQYVLIFRPVEP